jgi:hypothetical protein
MQGMSGICERSAHLDHCSKRAKSLHQWLKTVDGEIVISEDGKTRTVTAHATSPDGKKMTTTTVYDRQ